jgi:hypothetical protein
MLNPSIAVTPAPEKLANQNSLSGTIIFLWHKLFFC